MARVGSVPQREPPVCRRGTNSQIPLPTCRVCEQPEPGCVTYGSGPGRDRFGTGSGPGRVSEPVQHLVRSPASSLTSSCLFGGRRLGQAWSPVWSCSVQSVYHTSCSSLSFCPSRGSEPHARLEQTAPSTFDKTVRSRVRFLLGTSLAAFCVSSGARRQGPGNWLKAKGGI